MLHLDEAWQKAAEVLERLLAGCPDARAVLIEDLYGRLRVVLWDDTAHGSDFQQEVTRELTRVAEDYWSGEVWMASGAQRADQLVYDQAWAEARDTETANLKLLERHRNRGAWLGPVGEAPWNRPSGTEPWEPPVVVFYSFKGGVGRSTALASFAIRRARLGERVVVVDADLDAPGVGTLLAADLQGTTAHWGVVDYLLEQPLVPVVDLRDYYHTLSRENAQESFAERARDEFLDAYYAEDSISADASETLWTVSDAGDSDAPDVPTAITYNPNLVDFRTLDEVADLLVESADYSELARRIQERFGGG